MLKKNGQSNLRFGDSAIGFSNSRRKVFGYIPMYLSAIFDGCKSQFEIHTVR